jgi:hypothetical protein
MRTREETFSTEKATVNLFWPAEMSRADLYAIFDWLELVKNKMRRAVDEDLETRPAKLADGSLFPDSQYAVELMPSMPPPEEPPAVAVEIEPRPEFPARKTTTSDDIEREDYPF